jgi:putative acyl-CoA dehydrogenase
MAWGVQANEHPPVLHTHDRFGRRRDEVEFHPAWHELMAAGVRDGLHALPWATDEPGAHVARAALYQCAVQAEAGFGCPLTMTFAAVPALRAQPDVAAEWIPRLTHGAYDPELSAGKPSALCGMAMTEKQGGSDVRANTTRATAPAHGGPGGEYELTGHKWFCSAPMCDLFLVLARTDEGISCFALPRVLPDGTRNAGFHIQRLKDKLGNRSNASSEIELHGAWARMVGEPGRGVPTIIQMVNHTRLDCVIGAAGGMRAAVAQATWHAAHRRAFGARLAEQPAMANVLADLAIEAEAATSRPCASRARTTMPGTTPTPSCSRASRPRSASTTSASASRRTPPRRSSAWAATATSRTRGCRACTARRRSDRSGRARQRDGARRAARPALGAGRTRRVPRRGRRGPPAPTRGSTRTSRGCGASAPIPKGSSTARGASSRTSRSRWQASLLVRHAPPAVADAFCAARLDGSGGLAYGTLRPASRPPRSSPATPRPRPSLRGPGPPRATMWPRWAEDPSSSPACSGSASAPARAGSSCSS